MNVSLAEKNALICGGSQGIGLAIAEELALLGANCTLLSRSRENLEKAVSGLSKDNGQVHTYHVVDFNDTAATEKLLKTVISKSPFHILVNNSGGPAAGPIVDAKPDQFLKAFNQHLVTNHMLVTSVMEGMKKEGYGRIINVISTSVKVPLRNLGVSNTIRGAVASWAKTMANELGQFGITVNNILPGFTTTDRLTSLVEHISKTKGSSTGQVEKEMMEEVPLKRFGSPREIAAVAAFLATPAAAYVNGTSIPVDGGRTGSI